MKKKIFKYLKCLICATLIMSLTIPSYATLSASDGSAFVTKAEFDAALADFNSRLTTFESGINSKIDSQVTSYLDRNGIWSGTAQVLNQTYNLTYKANGTTYTQNNVPIGDGCTWGEIFGQQHPDYSKSPQNWKIRYHSGYQGSYGSSTEYAIGDWDTYVSYYNSNINYYPSVIVAGANQHDSVVVAQWQGSPTGTNNLHLPNYSNIMPSTYGMSTSGLSRTWTLIDEVSKSGLLFLDFAQEADFDPYLCLNSNWYEINWDTGLRFDFSLLFSTWNVLGNWKSDPWEEHWGDVSDSKAKAVTAHANDTGIVKVFGSGDKAFQGSTAQINISRFRKTINFFVAKKDKVTATVKTAGYCDPNSYLGRWNWSYTSNSTNLAKHGPRFKFYSATVY